MSADRRRVWGLGNWQGTLSIKKDREDRGKGGTAGGGKPLFLKKR